MDSVRRRDTTKGPPLRILSLDGGGVRGYSMLIILQELMYRTHVYEHGTPPRRDQIPKPCDHFDLIIGTGTGGLIALMLGRLRMDIETCKELYVRLTRIVFETDKTIAGIPYRSTLFKASKLEEVIKDVVAEHTVFSREGNDGTELDLIAPLGASLAATRGEPKRHSSNASVVSFSARSPQAQMTRPTYSNKLGNPNARLYDARENRTKTAVTAMYKGTPKGGDAVFLRSYDSRREPPPDFDCKIWQAGRATCAIGLAFKAIQIGQSNFHDDGAGTFNPAPLVLDEAVINEWPGREVGCFVSVGTGRRPKSSDSNQSLWYEGFMGEFAEARRRLISKIEGCETTHEYMMKEHLPKRNVNVDNYYRFNVEIGVGEFGMNEWHRLSEISTGTRRYLKREMEQNAVDGVASKLAKIHWAKKRLDALPDVDENKVFDVGSPLAIELPAEVPEEWTAPPSENGFRRSSDNGFRRSYDSGAERLPVPQRTPSPTSTGARSTPPPLSPQSPAPPIHRPPPPPAGTPPSAPNQNSSYQKQDHHGKPIPPPLPDRLIVSAPTPAQYRTASGADKMSITELDEQSRRPNGSAAGGGNQPNSLRSQGQPHRIEPPPIPPKTPLPEHQQARRPPVPGGGGAGTRVPSPPYPVDDEDEPPPPVNKALKPDYRRR